MEEYETVTLILNSYDISPSTNPLTFNVAGVSQTIDNQYGRISDNKSNLTWKNINLKMLMGNMFDKYETFNLYLYQIAQSQGCGSAFTFSGYNLSEVRISGLPFINNSYNSSTGINTNEALLTTFILGGYPQAQIGIVNQLDDPPVVTFNKGKDIVDINIIIKRVIDRKYQNVAPNLSFGTFVFTFKIRGIPSRENIVANGSRM